MKVKVNFINQITTKTGQPLSKVMEDAKVKFKFPCGKGKCGKCLVKITGDVNEPTKNEIKAIDPEKLAQGYRLACEVIVEGDINVVVRKK
ncbi:MAG: 2Fe-2S iron-sulfur cluster-binding protein [Acidaminobacteraceae bacterium]